MQAASNAAMGGPKPSPLLLPPWLAPPPQWWVQALLLEHNRAGGLAVDFRLPRQQLFNRCWIGTANGPQRLSVPLRQSRKGLPWRKVQLAPPETWARHWRQALQTAYGKAPFWREFQPELEAWICQAGEGLAPWTLAGLEWLAEALQLELPHTLQDPAGKPPLTESPPAACRYAAGDTRAQQRLQHVLLELADYRAPTAQCSVLDLLLHRGPLAGGALRQTAAVLISEGAQQQARN